MKTRLFFCIVLLLDGLAHGEESQPKTWTYENGVSLRKVEECKNGEGKQSVAVRGTPKEYIVEVRAFFTCDRTLKNPWVTLPLDGKATLVLDSKAPALFASSCDCFRSLSVSIAGRLSKGDTLYVVSEQVVVGHVVVP